MSNRPPERHYLWYVIMNPSSWTYFLVAWRALPTWVTYAGLEYSVHTTEREARDAINFLEERFGYTPQ